MKHAMIRCFAGLLAAVTLGCSAASAFAQQAPELQPLGGSAWLLAGRNGNVVMVAGDRGVLLIDDQRASDMEAIMAGARSLSAGPVSMVINTHWHLDHTGGNAALGEAGATIVAHRNVRERLGADQFMVAYNRRIPASPSIALPVVVYDSELDIHFGTETVRLRHTPSAHTDGDSLVFLESANVLHMGDIFFNGLFPFIDRSSGGGIQGLIRSVDVALSMTNTNTRIVPAHGPLATRADLQAWRAMLQDVSNRVQSAVDRGETLEAVIASQPAAAYRLQGDADRFVAAIYDSLVEAKNGP
jgi:glyoxylase-like metal-dependent hydrolase (beta-lactamase superfamily II)